MRPSLVSTVIAITVVAKEVAQAIPQHFDDKTYLGLLNNADAQIKTVYTSYLGTTIARCTAFLSSFSSILIIIVILRSETKLTSSYHRIMLGMSVVDAMGSLAIFCSTWMMPKDMIYTQFEGAVLGSSATCTTQGFFFLSGMISSFGFNTTLCIYYLCVIKYKFSEETFQKRAEPILFSLAFIIPLSLSLPLVVADLFAPTPFDFVCTEARYPYWCSNSGTVGDEVCTPSPTFQRFKLSLLTLYLSCAIVIFVSMFLVCRAVYTQERTLDLYMKNVHARHRGDTRKQDGENDSGKIKTTLLFKSETKTVMFQALAYLCALFACQLFPLMCLLNILHTNEIYMYFHVVLRPLQGFFNFLVFMGHKVCNRRRSNNEITRWKAFCEIFSNPKEEPTMFVGNIDIVFKLHPDHEEVIEEGEDDGVSLVDISYSDGRGLMPGGNLNSTVSPTGISFEPTCKGINSNVINTNASGLSHDYSSHKNTNTTSAEVLTDHDILRHDNLTTPLELKPQKSPGRKISSNSRKMITEMNAADDWSFQDDDLGALEMSYSESKPISSGSAISSWFSGVTNSIAGSRDISCAVSSLG
jgi:hypothetical protein